MLRTNLPKLDCSVSVITPENIAFDYMLAGPFQRLPAYAFDVLIRVMAFGALMFLMALTISWIPFGILFTFVIAFLLFFLLSWFYGIFFETRFNGRTPGKMLFRLRVISVDGRPINAIQAALRNLIRFADMYVPVSFLVFSSDAEPVSIIPTFIVGLVVMTITGRMQRLGDLAAGTMVISEHVGRTPSSMQPDDLRAFGLVELIPASYSVSSSLAQTVGLYMENRKRLSPMRRLEVAKHVAAPLIKRFELLPDTSPDLFLCALYVRIFMSDDQQSAGRERLRQVVAPRVPPPIRTAFATTPQPLGAMRSAREIPIASVPTRPKVDGMPPLVDSAGTSREASLQRPTKLDESLPPIVAAFPLRPESPSDMPTSSQTDRPQQTSTQKTTTQPPTPTQLPPTQPAATEYLRPTTRDSTGSGDKHG